ncbi:hypothetical protein TSUD_54810 [Trifolium subterraneum]|uniref:Reverse transcriptase domain-containing protein n=1 Tax=Trifolium subterraneum TaxID=3900 RepID=A0A2Z6N9Q2_TRISU|nr:hypothetical protein TSUD_54810 [Trifolium subterraneum]
MPPKKVNITEFRRIDAKVAALEGKMSEMKSTLIDVQNAVKTNHENLMAMFQKCFSKTLSEEEGSASQAKKGLSGKFAEPEVMEIEGSRFHNLRDDVLAEFRRSIKKVELPAFDGEESSWMDLASRGVLQDDECLSWTQLKEVLLCRYGGHGDGDVYEQLTDLKHDGTIEEYITEFEYLTAQIPKLPDKQFIGYFLHGLKYEIRGRVRSFAAMGDLSRSRLLQVTRAVEKEVKGGNGSGLTRNPRFGNGSHRPGSQNTGRGNTYWVMVRGRDNGPSRGARSNKVGPISDGLTQNERPRHGSRDRGFSRLTYLELLERKQKGLCFKCGKPFGPMHQCPEKQLRVLAVDEDGEDDTEGQILAVEVDEAEEEEGELSLLQFDHMAKDTPQTMRFRGEIQGVPILADMHLFELGGMDVVLGVEWLKTVGDTIMNWKKKVMSFWSNKKWVTLQGVGGGREYMETLQSTVNPTDRAGQIATGVYLSLRGTSRSSPAREREHVINLVEGQGAVNVRPYRYPHHHKVEIEKQIKEMLAFGIIRHNTSSFSSPVILVKKKDSTWRMCIDYRALNKVTIPDKFPIPIIEELLDELHGARFYSKLDLKSGYHQVRVKEEDVHKTAFRTHEGHYEFLVMPFGLMNAPSTFQSLMNEVFRPLLRKCVLVVFDDILVYSADWSSHIKNLKKGVVVDPNKVASVMQWPVPRNVKGVRGFLGLTGYYRKFIKFYGRIAKPLTELTKKDSFKWNDEAQKAFDELKLKLTTAPVLALPDFNKTFVIECNASELMAIGLAIQHWRPYLLGRKFVFSTDQRSLKQLLQQRISTAEQQNWAAKLLGNDFEIIYKQGKMNKGVDALSRINEGAELNSITTFIQWDQRQLMKEEIQNDEELRKIIADLSQDPTSRPGFMYKQGVLLYDGRLVMSRKSTIIPMLLKEFHDTPLGGHSRLYKTYRRLAANVYWLGMKNRVQEYVRSCDICQRQKYLTSSPGSLMQPLPIPERIWEDISMDFITGLPKSKGYEAIYIVVDRLSKYCHFIPLKHPYTARRRGGGIDRNMDSNNSHVPEQLIHHTTSGPKPWLFPEGVEMEIEAKLLFCHEVAEKEEIHLASTF